MQEIQMKLSAIWVAVALTYLLGDVLRIFAGDFKPGEIAGMKPTELIWLGIAALMVIPILMVVLTLLLDQPAGRWANIVVATGFFLFNVVGLPTYAGAYDKLLIVVSLALNALTVWLAWNWQ